MQGRTLFALTALVGSAALTPVTASAATTVTCSQLATLLAGNTNVTQTSSDNQGQVSPFASLIAPTGTNVGYCQVHFQFSSESGPAYGYAPGESQTIGLIFGLPLNSMDGGSGGVQGAWNGKINNLGGGGNVGTVTITSGGGGQTVIGAVNSRYVGSFTDGGHNLAQVGADGNYAVIQATHQLDLGEINDFTTEAQHQQYVWAKWLAEKYYGQAALRNYWYGCSTGGRQGLALAEKYAGDFDGMVVGAPAALTTEFGLSQGWPQLVNRDYVLAAGNPAITTAQFTLANNHAIAACDVLGSDTVADGVIDDPRQCTYSAANDPTILSAPAGTCTGANCVNLLQAQIIDKIWDGPRNELGRRLWHPFQKGTPLGGLFSVGPGFLVGLGISQAITRTEKDLTFAPDNVYPSPELAAVNHWGEPHPIALESAFALADGPGGAENYLGNLDLAGIVTLQAAGPKHPKFIMWQGGADNLIPTGDSIDMYRRIATAYGCHGNSADPARCKTDFAGLSSWFRYYRAPGVGHCGGGVGANPLGLTSSGNPQIFDDLVNWVENGVVPQSAGDSTHTGILAKGPGSFGTRPICPFPTTAIYSGTGSAAVASNYTCGGNLEANVATVCFGLHTAYAQETASGSDWKEQGGPPPADCPVNQ